MKTAARGVAALGVLLLVSGCGSSGSATLTGTDGDRATPAAEQPTSYDYRLTSSCGERGFLGTFDVVVRGDEVVRATAVRRYRGRVRLGEVPTLTDLVEMAQEADGDAVVDLVVDRRVRPRSLSIDHDPDALDDEECYEVDDLVVRPRPGRRSVGDEPAG